MGTQCQSEVSSHTSCVETQLFNVVYEPIEAKTL